MKLTKNHWMIIGAIVIIAIAYFLFFKKKPKAVVVVAPAPHVRSASESGYDIAPGIKGWEMPNAAR